MRYEICTEYKNIEGVKTVLGQYFECYNLTEGIGCWKGSNEHSLTISLVGVRESTVERAALDIKRLNNQEAVLVVKIPCTHHLI